MKGIVHRDGDQTAYIIPAEHAGKTVGGENLTGSAGVEAWWTGSPWGRANERFLIKQDNNPDRADVIELTQAQVYALLFAMNHGLGLTKE